MSRWVDVLIAQRHSARALDALMVHLGPVNLQLDMSSGRPGEFELRVEGHTRQRITEVLEGAGVEVLASAARLGAALAVPADEPVRAPTAGSSWEAIVVVAEDGIAVHHPDGVLPRKDCYGLENVLSVCGGPVRAGRYRARPCWGPSTVPGWQLDALD